MINFLRYRLLHCFSFIFFISTLSNAQWIQSNGPYGGSVSSFAVSVNGRGDTCLFAGTWDGGIFRSTNYGTNWTAANSGLTSPHVYALTAGPDVENLFAGANTGVFRSTNNGTSWNQIHGGLPNTAVMSLTVSPDGVHLFAGGWNIVYVSSDNGVSWMASELTKAQVLSLAVTPDGSILFAGTNGGGVVRSTDNGMSWVAVNSGLASPYVRSLALSPDGSNLFAGTYGGGVFRSTDNGTSWSAANSGLTYPYLYALTVGPDADNLFAGTNGGVFHSTDNGGSWTHTNNGLTDMNVYSFAVSPDGRILFAGTYYGGVFRSTNNGERWSASNDGLANTSVYSIVPSPDRSHLFASTYNFDFQSTDNGANWEPDVSGLPSFLTYVHADSVMYVGTSNGVYRSSDNGSSWDKVNSGMEYASVTSLAVSPGGTNLFAGTYSGGVFRSTDKGESWYYTGLTGTGVLLLALSPEGSSLFAGTNVGVFHSTDNGTSWAGVNNGLPSAHIRDLAISSDGTNLFAATTVGIYRSSDDGASWSAANTGLPDLSISSLDIIVYDGKDLLISGTDNGGIFLSDPQCVAWRPFGTGMWIVPLHEFVVNGVDIFAATSGAGIFRRPLAEIVSGGSYPPHQRGIITGRVFHDRNLNGVPDSTEESLPGRVITLSGKHDEYTIADCSGRFIFTGLDSGSYTVKESPTPYPWVTVSPAEGEYTVSRTVNDSSGYLTFGEYYPHGSIDGRVYADRNVNGIFDAGEEPVSGIILNLTGRGTGSVKSDSNGRFLFEALPPGTFTLILGAPFPWVVSSPPSGKYSITLGYDSSSSNDFGMFFPWCTISGKVFWDVNENGTCDSAESPLGRWLVRSSGTSSDSVFTDSLGNYLLYVDRGLRAVLPAIPAGWEVVPLTHQGGDSIIFNDYDKHEAGHDFGLHRIPRRARITLSVHDNTAYETRDLFWGIRSGATAGIWGIDRRSTFIDFAEGESELPPRDFAAYLGLFDARFIAPPTPHGAFGEGSWTDMRNYDSSMQSNEFRIALLPGYRWGGNYPMTILWSQDSVAAYFDGSVTLDDERGVVTDMKRNSSFVVSDTTIQFLRLIASSPNLVAVRRDRVATLPTDYRLFQNYPNPFNPKTDIRFQIPAVGWGHVSPVQVKIFDVLGREVATLVDKELEPGEYTVSWDAGNMPSGVYFYRMKAGTFLETWKMLLLR